MNLMWTILSCMILFVAIDVANAVSCDLDSSGTSFGGETCSDNIDCTESNAKLNTNLYGCESCASVLPECIRCGQTGSHCEQGVPIGLGHTCRDDADKAPINCQTCKSGYYMDVFVYGEHDSFKQAFDSLGTKNKPVDMCKPCPDGETSDKGATSVDECKPPVDCATSETNPITGKSCKCDPSSIKNECPVGKYCYNEGGVLQCKFDPPYEFIECDPSDHLKTGKKCRCNPSSETNECADDKYCYDNTCHPCASGYNLLPKSCALWGDCPDTCITGYLCSRGTSDLMDSAPNLCPSSNYKSGCCEGRISCSKSVESSCQINVCTPECSVGEYCDNDNTCKSIDTPNNPTLCTPSGTSAITGNACKCASSSSSNECAVGKYCYDNTCNSGGAPGYTKRNDGTCANIITSLTDCTTAAKKNGWTGSDAQELNIASAPRGCFSMMGFASTFLYVNSGSSTSSSYNCDSSKTCYCSGSGGGGDGGGGDGALPSCLFSPSRVSTMCKCRSSSTCASGQYCHSNGNCGSSAETFTCSCSNGDGLTDTSTCTKCASCDANFFLSGIECQCEF